jgi:Flp pilus assembly protein TadG
MMKSLRLKLMWASEAGSVAIECAFIFPFMLVLYFGMIDLTGYISQNRKITSIAGSVADLVGQHRKSIYQADFADYFKIAALVMKPSTDTDVRVRVFAYRKAAVVTDPPVLIWAVNNNKGVNCTSMPTTADINALMAAGNDVVVAQACTNYKPFTRPILVPVIGKSLIGGTLLLTEQTIMLRPRTSLTLECYSATSTVSGASTCPKTL